MAWRVNLVSPDGKKRPAGNVKSYKLKKTAEAALKHYSRFIRLGATFKGYKVELVEI
jgi:hypothetical protein